MIRKVALLLFLVVFGGNSVAWAAPLNNSITNGLVAAYEFTGDANDVSGNGNDGVVNGATLTTDRFGNANSAYNFDGVDDYIISSSPYPQQLSGTISFWLRDTSPAGVGGMFLSSRSTSGYETGDILIGNSEGGDLFRAIYWGNGGWEGFGSIDLPINSWKHFSLTWTAESGSSMYIDGIQGTSGSAPFSAVAPPYPIFSNLPLELGRNNCCPGSFITDFAEGDIDDVYIYDRALSPTEVFTLATVPEPSTGLLLATGLLGLGINRRRAPRSDGRVS